MNPEGGGLNAPQENLFANENLLAMGLEGVGGGPPPQDPNNDPEFTKKFRTDGWQSIFNQQPVRKEFFAFGKTRVTYRFAQLNDEYMQKARENALKVNPNGFAKGRPENDYMKSLNCMGQGGRFAQNGIDDFTKGIAGAGMELRYHNGQVYFRKDGRYYRGIKNLKKVLRLAARHPMVRFIKFFLAAKRAAASVARFGQLGESDQRFYITKVAETDEQAAKQAYSRLKAGIKAAEAFKADPDKYSRARTQFDNLKGYMTSLEELRTKMNTGGYRDNMMGYLKDVAEDRHTLYTTMLNSKTRGDTTGLKNIADQVNQSATQIINRWPTMQNIFQQGPRFQFQKRNKRGETYTGPTKGGYYQTEPTI